MGCENWTHNVNLYWSLQQDILNLREKNINEEENWPVRLLYGDIAGTAFRKFKPDSPWYKKL